MEALATEKRRVRAPARDPDLEVRLEGELPSRLAIGRGNAVFIYGSCFHRRSKIKDLRIVVDGEPQPVMAHGMPRRDLFLALHQRGFDHMGNWRPERDDDTTDPHGHAYKSGFWAIVPFEPCDRPHTAHLEIAATLDDGTEATGELAALEVEPGPGREPVPWRDGRAPDQPLIGIGMATYNPPIELFRRQIESIRTQTHGNWVCVVSDDRSQPSRFAAMEEVLDGDPRFVISRSPRRLGFYHNFERALSMIPEEAAYVTLADQDDQWHPDKLEVQLDNLGDAQLTFSDARIVSKDGEVLSDTYWSRRRPNHSNLGSLLISNTITGAASLFRSELLEYVLPFPPRHGTPYHDHWIGLVALASGELSYIDRPLYDYVQHHGAVLGHARANRLPTTRERLADRLRTIREDWRAPFAGWRVKYFYAVCRLLQFAHVLEMRCGDRMKGHKRRALKRFAAIDRSPRSAAWLAVRRARRVGGGNETLGAEWILLHGVAWRRLLRLLNYRREWPSPRWPNDASLPAEYTELRAEGPEIHQAVRFLREKLVPLELDIREDGPERVNVLIPTIDLRHVFAGYIAKFNLARKLAESGLRARLVAVDEVDPLPRGWEQRLESYRGLRGLLDRVEIAFAHTHPLEVSPRDSFVASTWWTAHRAHRALESLERERFVYLIQEYEPYTFPMGSVAATASEPYNFPHFALFSTEILREFFKHRGIGVFAKGSAKGERDSISFQNAITPTSPPSPDEIRTRENRRVLFYARPELNNTRNMFELGVMALADCVSEGVFGPEWEFYSIGATEGWHRLGLGPGVVMEVVPRKSQDEYAELLESHDLGLALMYTPHPSLVPIEMASAGMLVVTNSFENKTPEAMAQISTNLITTEPSLDDVKAGLREAAANVGDAERRVAGAAVEWSRDWDTSFNEQVMERLATFLAES